MEGCSGVSTSVLVASLDDLVSLASKFHELWSDHREDGIYEKPRLQALEERCMLLKTGASTISPKLAVQLQCTIKGIQKRLLRVLKKAVKDEHLTTHFFIYKRSVISSMDKVDQLVYRYVALITLVPANRCQLSNTNAGADHLNSDAAQAPVLPPSPCSTGSASPVLSASPITHLIPDGQASNIHLPHRCVSEPAPSEMRPSYRAPVATASSELRHYNINAQQVIPSHPPPRPPIHRPRGYQASARSSSCLTAVNPVFTTRTRSHHSTALPTSKAICQPRRTSRLSIVHAAFYEEDIAATNQDGNPTGSGQLLNSAHLATKVPSSLLGSTTPSLSPDSVLEWVDECYADEFRNTRELVVNRSPALAGSVQTLIAAPVPVSPKSDQRRRLPVDILADFLSKTGSEWP